MQGEETRVLSKFTLEETQSTAEQSTKPALLGLVFLITAVTLYACGGGSEPEDRDFDLAIADRALNLDPPIVPSVMPAVMKVKQGDSVTLRIGSDEHGSLHLHGYDIEREVGPDKTATMVFTADATGNFTITFHPGDGDEHAEEGEEHDEDEEITIGSLEVHPR